MNGIGLIIYLYIYIVCACAYLYVIQINKLGTYYVVGILKRLLAFHIFQ